MELCLCSSFSESDDGRTGGRGDDVQQVPGDGAFEPRAPGSEPAKSTGIKPLCGRKICAITSTRICVAR